MFFFKMTTWNIKYNISIRLIKRVKTFIISVTGLEDAIRVLDLNEFALMALGLSDKPAIVPGGQRPQTQVS